MIVGIISVFKVYTAWRKGNFRTGDLVNPFESMEDAAAIDLDRLLAAAGFCEQAKGDDIRKVEDRCIKDAIARQESVGLQSIAEGEMRRDWG